ncbi:MAG: tight adherence protein [Nocardioidaceae bacterium]|jgi:Flp pilus assembly protein TadB|nr:tight adherence protein [Nocardioidaceae bacterium]
MIAFMVAVALVAAALLHAYRLAVPRRADLAGAVRRWDSSRARAARIQRIGVPRATTVGGKVQGWLAEQVLRRYRNIKWLTQDLAVSGGTVEQYVAKTTVLALTGFFGPLVIVGFFNTLGLGLPLIFAPVAGVVLAAVMVLVTRQEVTDKAKKRRAEFRRTLSIYLDLVAMSMQAGRGHAEALPASAAIGTGWAFTHLQDAIDGARFSGTTAWHALGQLGERFGIRELTDLDAALTLANEDGAKVRATLVARAETLRTERIADAGAAAAKATESMRFALIVMVFAFLTYELYPSIARLFAG